MAGLKKPTTESAPVSAKARAKVKSRALLIFYFLVLLGVTVGAVLLCVFVFFKVGNIHITGAAIYPPQEIAAASGILSGDNLVFTNTDEVEKKLFAKFPYIEKVQVKKKIPSTIEIALTEAQVYYSMAYGGEYVYVSKMGKILEKNPVPFAGSILFEAGEITDEGGYVKFAKEENEAIFAEIREAFAEKGKDKFTKISIADIYNITLVYDDRIEFQLGNSADITYKISFGLEILSRGGVAENERGVLDLSQAKSVNKVYFTPDALTNSGSESGTTSAPGEEVKPKGENSSDEESRSEGGDSEEESTADSEGDAGDEGDPETDTGDEGDPQTDDTDEGDPEGGGTEEESSAPEQESTRGQDIPDVA